MSEERYPVCQDEQKRTADLRAEAGGGGQPLFLLNGIDFIEVDPADQRLLVVGFLHPLPGEPGEVPAGPPLTPANLVVEGGERIVAIAVTAVAASGAELTVTVDRAGDFSPYVK